MKLEIGTNDHFEVRNEKYSAAIAGSFSVLYLSDLHFNRNSNAIALKMISRINQLDPDIILLGGDYVDFKTQLVHLETLLKSISHRDNVFAIAGNHDYAFGVDTIRKMMEVHKIGWIENSSVNITVKNTSVQIDGTQPSAHSNTSDFSILCLHHPVDIIRFKQKYNLVFAGHLHGCQLVFWQNEKGLYPGRLLFKWNMLKKEIDNAHFYISKGLGGRVPLRFNCSKEMVLVEVKGHEK
ncbi:MAG: metallophosphoesterase [Ferruginibacter sp.]